MFRRYLNSLIMIGLCLNTSCVDRNPSHRLPKIIKTDIFINNNDKLCFKPDFTTATVGSEPHDLDEINDVSFSISRYEPDKFVTILEDRLPEKKEYHGLPICLEENVNYLLSPNNKYTFCMDGIEPKEFFSVRSCTEFIYKEDNTIQIERKVSG